MPRLTWRTAPLLPLAWLYRGAVAARRALYAAGVFRVTRLRVPVVVVGNITAGGTGKTPLARALAEALVERGHRPGLVSRGYGGSDAGPRAVAPDDDPAAVGDEAPILAGSGLPVFIGHDRVAAALELLAAHADRTVIVTDDGLQHYALAREFEIAVVDESRGLGNGYPIPAGPLREPASRLDTVGAIVRLVPPGVPAQPSRNGGRDTAMTYEPLAWRNLVDASAAADLSSWRAGNVHAIAATGHPQRFFDLVRQLGIDATPHAFPDHHVFAAGDLAFPGATVILMTEKDAVKCVRFADARCWYLPIRACLDPALVERVVTAIGVRHGSQAA